MAVSHSPGLLVGKSGRASGTQLRRVFLVQSGTDADTGGPVIVFDDTGPADYVFTYDSVNGLILIEDDPDDLTHTLLNCVLNEAGETIFYT